MRRTLATPYRVKLLGGLSLEGTEKLSGRITQRRQLALLALLAGHQTTLSRDKVIGFLWPDTGTDQARHILSDSIYIIRKALGENAIVVTGDGVALNTDVVGSDVHAFRSALANESYGDALASYGGPFLDGFYPDESEPFERWMSDERESLQRAAARAAWSLVDQAEAAGEPHEAIRWARRAMKIVPEDERGLRRLIALYDALGSRAGAVRAYEEFAAWLEAELDVQPSEETQTLITAIRERRDSERPSETQHPLVEPAASGDAAEPDTAGTTRKRISLNRAALATSVVAVAVLTAWLFTPRTEDGSPLSEAGVPASVAVLPFEVRGEGLDLWREGMVDLLSTNVDVFAELRAVPSRTVLAQWREAGLDDSADMAQALDIARKTGARYAVTGTVTGMSEGLRIRGQMFDLKSGDQISDAVALGVPDSILVLVDRLSVELVSPFLEPGARYTSEPRLARVTTGSPAALRAFLDGERLYRSGQYEASTRAYRRAVEADTTFALAYYRLIDASGSATGGMEADNRYLEMATRYADRLPERERRLRQFDGDDRTPFETLREAVRLYPSDAEAWYWLGETSLHAGLEVPIPNSEFVDAFERSIALDPGFFPAYEHLVHAAFFLTPDSARAADLIERQSRSGEIAPETRVAFDLVFGDAAHRRAAEARLETLTPMQLQIIAAWFVAHPRYLRLRELALRTALAKASPNFELHHTIGLFWTLLGLGRVADAIDTSQDPALIDVRATLLYEARMHHYPIPDRALVRALAETSADVINPAEVPAVFERGAYAAEIGDWATHARAKQELRTLIPDVDPANARDTLRLKGLIEALDGYAAWQRDDEKTALRLLRRAQEATRGSGDENKGMQPRNRIIRWWLAELLLEIDRLPEALAYYESTLPLFQQDPMIFFCVAPLREQLGDRDGAIEAYEAVLAAWSGDIDPDFLPLAATAWSEAARLRGLKRE